MGLVPNQKFQFGHIVATQGAQEAMQSDSTQYMRMLERHGVGDWGDVCEEDKQTNDISLRDGLRLVSVYYTKEKVKIWVITEWDRSATTFLLPSEY